MSIEPTPQEKRDMKLRAERDFQETAWVTLLSKKIGTVDTWTERGLRNPYLIFPFPCDDFVKGLGVPAGFKERVFYLPVNPKDPRLTLTTIDRIAERLKYAANAWLEKQDLFVNNLTVCKTPVIEIVRNDSAWSDPTMAGKTYVMLRIHIYETLIPVVFKADPNSGDMGEPVKESE